MSLTVVLAVGLDSWLLSTHSAVWRSEGYIVISAVSISEAIDHFRAGDFDLVLLGDSISLESKQRLTSLIRASGSQIPVVSVANSSTERDSFADATLKNDASALLTGMGEVLANKSKMRAGQTVWTAT
jgi:DNA-binding response OmpR family regulator